MEGWCIETPVLFGGATVRRPLLKTARQPAWWLASAYLASAAGAAAEAAAAFLGAFLAAGF